MDNFQFTKMQLATGSAIGLLLYYAGLAIYRLYFSPLSKFPGPKLAALTYWYEFYYDIILRGQYIFHVKTLHERYGPIIRINPNELHIGDPTFHATLYGGAADKRDRVLWHTQALGLPTSTLGSVPHELWRRRRAALNPFFSMASVRRLEGVVRERIEVLVGRLLGLMDDDTAVPMNLAFSAWSNDVVNDYCFGRSDRRVEAEGFDPEFHHTSFKNANSTPLMKHMNWILRLAQSLPESIALRMGPEAASFIILQRVCLLLFLLHHPISQVFLIETQTKKCLQDMKKQIVAVKASSPSKQHDAEHPTIFHELLKSSLPDSEKSVRRLSDEGILLIGAGTHTSAWCLSVATFHILANIKILRSLKTELASASSTTGVPINALPLTTVETLPYLTAVIKEALRLSYGTSMRLARSIPDAPLQFKDWTIPPGTSVSMTSTLIHHDESIFPDSKEFIPDRWLGDQRRVRELDKFMVAFSKGGRACLGVNLAWAELYLCLAGIFSVFGGRFAGEEVVLESDKGVMELFETDVTDVAICGDLFFPLVKEGSQGVRVKIKSV